MKHIHKHQKLGLTIVLNVTITIGQIVGGIISGSLALISDALHNLSDSLAIVLAYVADRISQKKKTSQSTFGFKRAEIIAAFINGLVLVSVSIYLIVEAIQRFIDPRSVDFRWMIGLGFLGFAANTISVFILHDEKDGSLNVKAAYLHLIGDALASSAVIVGGMCIWFWGWYWIDPLVAILISLYLLYYTYGILKETTSILMQFAPFDVLPEQVALRLAKIDGVEQAYHIHIWRLTDRTIHFEAHIVLKEDIKLSETKMFNQKLTRVLKEEFGFQHLTFQFEYK